MTQVLIRPHAEDCEMIEIYSIRKTSTAEKQFILWGTVHVDMLDHLGFDWATDDIVDFKLALLTGATYFAGSMVEQNKNKK
tara:strand:- start:3107 stop:3349 length:243 start_codon:yes stop_codon:yes gene_type:complete